MTTTITNPVIYSDFPDVDVIRVDDAYYMISTTMHFMPGGIILRSYNLKDWEIASRVFDAHEDYPAARLERGQNIYGSGMWAASLKYHNGKFYVLHIANDTKTSYMYEAEKIEGPWKMHKVRGFYHDPALFFDDDGRAYIAYGNTEIHLVELNENLTAPKEGGLNKVIVREKDDVILGYEGSHLYKIDGKYYLFLIHWPKGKPRTEACFAADSLDGEWIGGDVLSSDLGDGINSGVAQGGVFATPDGQWFGMFFQDHGAQGRMPCLVPMKIENGKFAVQKKGRSLKSFDITIDVPADKSNYEYKPLFDSDNFNYPDGNPKLKEVWEWNHIPNNQNWFIKDGKFCVRTAYRKQNVVTVQNTLTQRVFGVKPKANVMIDAGELKDGDVAGLCAFESSYGFVGLTKKNGKTYVVRGEKNYPNGKVEPTRSDREPSKITDEIEISGNVCEVKAEFDFTNLKDEVKFFYKDGAEWKQIGKSHKVYFLLDHFCGVRAGLFVYATETAGGVGKFDDFVME